MPRIKEDNENVRASIFHYYPYFLSLLQQNHIERDSISVKHKPRERPTNSIVVGYHFRQGDLGVAITDGGGMMSAVAP